MVERIHAPMRAYAIAGPALDPCSWEPSFVNYRPGKIEVIRNDAIPSDGVLYFKKNGNYANYVGLGWSHPEKDWVWSWPLGEHLFARSRQPIIGQNCY